MQCSFTHFCAKGYPNCLYGNMQYHYKISGIDENFVADAIRKLI